MLPTSLTGPDMSTERAGRASQSVGLFVVARALVCAALFGAAAVHATVVTEHYELWPLAGVFFLVLQVAEAFLAVAVYLAWTPRSAAVVAAVSLAAVAVWAVSRTVGVPVGNADLRQREPVGTADLACVVLEVVAAVVVLPWLRPDPRLGARHIRAEASVGITAVGVLLIAGVTVVGLAPAMSGENAHAHAHAQRPATRAATGDIGLPPADTLRTAPTISSTVLSLSR
jgi:hypothetical protein